MPKRIQLRRTPARNGPGDAVVVSGSSEWANPFPTGQFISPVQAVARFRFAIENGLPGVPTAAAVREHLAGRDLACTCRPSDPCHADVLLEIANANV